MPTFKRDKYSEARIPRCIFKKSKAVVVVCASVDWTHFTLVRELTELYTRALP